MISPLGRCLALTLTLLAGTAIAGQMPADVAARIKELGPVIDPPKTAPIYAPLQQKEPYQGVKVERDVKYGPADRNRLDVFTPDPPSTGPKPVLIFVHGGGFVAGDKHPPGSPFYDNVMLWALKEGFVGVNMTYRLAPQSPWPAGAEDVASVVRWVADNIAARGGDPARVYLMGHSAGAVHVASYVSHPEFQGPKGNGLAGAILVSGLYDLTLMPVSDLERAYFGTDTAVYKERSSLEGLVAGKTPLLVVRAELDPPPFVKGFDELRERLCAAARGCARTVVLPQHSHISELYAVNSGDTALTDEILAFVKAGGK
ncbi:MAG: alpha/beta hydrolase [Xanthobacteraceae bacterium]